MDRTHKVVVETRKTHNSSSTIDDLPDDVIVGVLSRVDLRLAASTSVLSRRWRYLSSFCSSGTLKLDYRDLFSSDDDDLQVASGKIWDNREINTIEAKFTGWVNRVLKLHEGLSLCALIICSTVRQSRSDVTEVHRWVYYAMRKKVKALELDFANYSDPHYEFPLSLPSRICSAKEFSFASLTSLRLVGVNIKDETVRHYLANLCPNLQHLSISGSRLTVNLQIVDPLPSLRALEVFDCPKIKSLEILVMRLVSCTYQGKILGASPFREIPNLTELTLGGDFARSFIYEPKRHMSCSAQLVRLGLNILKMFNHKPRLASSSYDDRNNFIYDPYWKIDRPELPRLSSLQHLELNFVLPIGKSIHFFLKFINAAPLLKQLKIKISYMVTCPKDEEKLGFPEEGPSTTMEGGRRLKKLKVVSMSGYVGCSIDDKFILRLVNNSTMERVAIDTESEYYEQNPGGCTTPCGRRSNNGPPCVFCTNGDTGARTRVEAKRRAKLLKLSFPPNSKTVLVVT